MVIIYGPLIELWYVSLQQDGHVFLFMNLERVEMEEDNWEVGDIAICVKVGDISNQSGVNPLLRLYGEYIVNGLYLCSCGSLSLDVGLVTPYPRNTKCNCERLIGGLDIHWCDSIRFVKKKSKQMVELELAAAVEAENYELATELRDRLISM